MAEERDLLAALAGLGSEAPPVLPGADGSIDPDDLFALVGEYPLERDLPEVPPDLPGLPEPVAELFAKTVPIDPAQSLLIQQYRDKPNINAFIAAFQAELDVLFGVFSDLTLKRSLDTAEGAQLDVIGKIVVLERPDLDVDIDDAFEFGSISETPGPDDAEQIAYDAMHGFSAIGRPDIGGRFLSIIPESNIKADDELYRRFLKAKIIKNTADGSIPTIIRYFSFVFDANVTIATTIGEVSVQVDRPISFRERKLITEGIPLAGGIALGQVFYGAGPEPFGLDGSDANSGYWELDTPPLGSGYVDVLV